MSLLDGIKRRWRSRGHGIHSPFAFRFVTQVLGDAGRGYAYYGYSRLPQSSSGAWLRLLFRLTCEFRPERVHASARLSAAERKAILLADSRVTFTEAPEASPLFTFDTHRGKVKVYTSAEALQTDAASMTGGMTFSNGREGIAVCDTQLPRQNFEILFAHRPAL